MSAKSKLERLHEENKELQSELETQRREQMSIIEAVQAPDATADDSRRGPQLDLLAAQRWMVAAKSSGATAHLEESIGQLLELMEKQKTFEVQMARGTEEDSSKDQGSMDVDEELLGAALSDPVFSSLDQSARRKLCEELNDALAKRRRLSKSPLPGCG